MTYIATFYSHFGAIRYKKLCQEKGMTVRVMPVPRDLSSSCGTCAQYDSDVPCPFSRYPEEVEQVVEVMDSGYRLIYRAENG